MPRKKKAREMTTEEVLRRVFDRKVASRLKRTAKELDAEKERQSKPSRPSRKKT